MWQNFTMFSLNSSTILNPYGNNLHRKSQSTEREKNVSRNEWAVSGGVEMQYCFQRILLFYDFFFACESGRRVVGVEKTGRSMYILSG